MARFQSLPWDAYRPLVMKLFGVREAPPTLATATTWTATFAATQRWLELSRNPKLSLDRVCPSLHKMVRGKSGERIYVIAPGRRNGVHGR
ncbi:MAG: hypothetical protein R3C56_29950 [Pirellulaceae bacterium]